MAKKVAGTMKLQVPAGQANPSPPVGPALGQRGINIMEFCKAFNAKTQELEAGCAVPHSDHLLSGQVVLDGYQDAACVLLPEESGQAEIWRKNAQPRSCRFGHHQAGARDRRGEDERPECANALKVR